MKTKKMVAGVMALLLTSTVLGGGLVQIPKDAPKAYAADGAGSGDLNADGQVNMADIVVLSKYLLRQTSTVPDGADLDANGQVNAIDLSLLKRILLGSYTPVDLTGLVINEVCAQNDTILADANGEYSDWIEIYNGSKQAVNLAGYGLSDAKKTPFKWVFPDVEIPAGAYLIVFASDKDTVIGNELHTNYKLSKDGENIVLTHPTLGTLDVMEMPAIGADVSYGRYENGVQNPTKLTPTPGASNETAQEYVTVDPPQASLESGSYASGTTVSLTAAPGMTIYYTTDGSDPTTSDTAYTAGIAIQNRTDLDNVYAAITGTTTNTDFIPKVKVTKSTILRAVAVDAKGNVSAPVTKTYFVGVNLAAQYPDTAVISLVTDPDNLFDYETGIYVKGKVFDDYMKENPGGGGGWFGGMMGGKADGSTPANYNQRGSEWERSAHLDFFEPGGTLGFSQDIGIRTMGGWSRATQQKNFRCYARDEYGAGKFKYDLIPGLSKQSDDTTPISKFKTFLLRAGGNDCARSKIRDMYIQSLVADRDYDTQACRPCVVFLDGEYWGVYNIREDYTDNYIEDHYDVDKDNVVMFKCGELEEGEESDATLYSELLDFARSNDLSVDANYQKICTMMDMDSYVDYYATQIYIDNTDWPNNNYRAWRSRTVTDAPYEDGKWRWMLYDTECSMNIYGSGNYTNDTFAHAAGTDSMWGGSDTTGDHYALYNGLIQNEQFKEKLVTTIMDLRNVNFRPETAKARLDEIEAQYSPLMEEQYARYGAETDLQKYSSSLNYFKELLTTLSTYVKNRYDYMPTLTKNALKLQGNAVEVTLKTNNAQGGSVQINTTTPDLSGGSWTGTYFTDYAVTLTATPAPGHSFTGWTGGATGSEATITVPLSTAITIQANFN